MCECGYNRRIIANQIPEIGMWFRSHREKPDWRFDNLVEKVRLVVRQSDSSS